MLVELLCEQLANHGVADELLEQPLEWALAHPLLVGERVAWSARARAGVVELGEQPIEAAGCVVGICEPAAANLAVSYFVRFDDGYQGSGFRRQPGELVARRLSIEAALLEQAAAEPTSGWYDPPMGDRSIGQICDRLAELGVPESALRPIRLWKAAPRLRVGDRVRWSEAVLGRDAAGLAAGERGTVLEVTSAELGERFTSYVVRWETAEGETMGFHQAEQLQRIGGDEQGHGELQSA